MYLLRSDYLELVQLLKVPTYYQLLFLYLVCI